MRSSKPTPNPRRHVGFTVAAAAVLPLVAGCGAANADTNSDDPQWEHAVSPGASGAADTMEAHGAVAIGPEVGELLPAGSDIGLYAMLANTEFPDNRELEGLTQEARESELEEYAEELTEVSVGVAERPRGEYDTTPTPAQVDFDGPVEVVPENPVQIDPDEPLAVLQDMDEDLRGGENLEVTFSFADSGDMVLDVPIIPQNDLETSGWAEFPTPEELEDDQDEANENNDTNEGDADDS